MSPCCISLVFKLFLTGLSSLQFECTLGYHDKHKSFEIRNNVEIIFKQHGNLKGSHFKFRISEIALVKSKYKNSDIQN